MKAYGPSPISTQIGRDLAGARVGLLGYGAIAAEVAKRLRAFDCEVVYYRPSGPVAGVPGFLPFDEMIGGVDILSLHAPSSPATRRIIDAARIAAMRPGTVLINTARGDLVDEAALAAALLVGTYRCSGARRLRPRTPGRGLRPQDRAEHGPFGPFRRPDAGELRPHGPALVRQHPPASERRPS